MMVLYWLNFQNKKWNYLDYTHKSLFSEEQGFRTIILEY